MSQSCILERYVALLFCLYAVIPLLSANYLLERITHVSHLIELGLSAVAIADRVGHESIDITYRYAHLFPSTQIEMADKLDIENDRLNGVERQDVKPTFHANTLI